MSIGSSSLKHIQKISNKITFQGHSLEISNPVINVLNNYHLDYDTIIVLLFSENNINLIKKNLTLFTKKKYNKSISGKNLIICELEKYYDIFRENIITYDLTTDEKKFEIVEKITNVVLKELKKNITNNIESTKGYIALLNQRFNQTLDPLNYAKPTEYKNKNSSIELNTYNDLNIMKDVTFKSTPKLEGRIPSRFILLNYNIL